MSTPYATVTARIVAQLEAGTPPWSQPWTAGPGGGRPLRSDGTPYRGANTLNLWSAAMARGFASRHWMTYKTAQGLGAQVKKGARSELAFFVGTVRRQEERDGGMIDRTIPFLQSYNVFNADEIEGLGAAYIPTPPPPTIDATQRIADADDFLTGTGARIIVSQSGRAFYRPAADEIHLPPFETFVGAAEYYCTALHELTHWTSAESRLNRIVPGKLFGSPEYAFEELVAELGAAFLCADLALTPTPRLDHASYIASWIRCLRSDERAIFRAAAHAERAALYLHRQQPGRQSDPAEIDPEADAIAA